MQITTKSTSLSTIIQTIAQKTFSLQPFISLKQQLMIEDEKESQITTTVQQQSSIATITQPQQPKFKQNDRSQLIVEKTIQIAPIIKQEQSHIQPENNQVKIVTQQSIPIIVQTKQIVLEQLTTKNEQPQSKEQIKQKIDDNEIQINQPVMIINSLSQKNINELKQPPFLSNKKNYTEQSNEKDKSSNKDANVKFKKLSSEDDSINFDLTQKMKKSNNMLYSNGRVDSLIYSDATLMYSNATGFGQEIGQQSFKNSHRRQSSHKSQLNRIEDNGENAQISARMSRAESREVARLRTDSENKTDLQIHIKTQQDQSEQNVFHTDIYDKKKITKIKELKESKKKQLERQLRRVNEQIQQLTRRQTQARSNPKSTHQKSNNYESRVKISDNIQAKVKAEKLIKNLRYQKKSRHDAHLDELQVLDKNINQYMQEIVKEKYKNEDRIKQKKKLDIIQRMKKQQLRKIQQQKMKEKNLQFLHQIKNSSSKNNLVPIRSPQQKQVKQVQSYLKQKNQQMHHHVPTKERSHTKKSESIIDQSEMTPQLSRKKALMKRLRNLSLKKDKDKKADVYEQVLG